MSDGVAAVGRWLKPSVGALLTLAAVYAAATLWAGRAEWHVALDEISPFDVAIAISLITVGALVRGVRWKVYLNLLGYRVPFLLAMSAFTAGFALTATPAKVGELVKVAILRSRYHVSYADGAGVLLIERLGDLFAVILLAATGLTLFEEFRGYFAACVALVFAGTLFLGQPVLLRKILTQIEHLPLLKKNSVRLSVMLAAVQALLKPRPLLFGLALAIAAWACEASAFNFLATRLGVPITLLTSFSIFGLATLAGALSMLPGGVGGFELVMGVLLVRIGTSSELATVSVVIFRLCTLWLFSLVGLVFLLGWIVQLSRRNFPAGRAE